MRAPVPLKADNPVLPVRLVANDEEETSAHVFAACVSST